MLVHACSMYSAHVEHVGSIVEDAVVWNVGLCDVHHVLTANGIYVWGSDDIRGSSYQSEVFENQSFFLAKG